MENVSIYDTSLKATSLYFENLKRDYNNYDIKKISIGYVLNINNDKLVHYTDLEHSITYCDNNFFNDGLLTFDEVFYSNNREEINKLIIEIVTHTRHPWFSIDDKLAKNINIIESLCNNPNVSRILLEDVVLTKELYEIFKKYNKEVKTDGVVPELEENFDSIIIYNTNKYLISYDNYERISTAKEYTLNGPVDENEMRNLKYFKDDVKITIKYDDYQNVFKVIDAVTQLKPNATFLIKVDDKNLFNMSIFSNINEMVISNVYVDCNSSKKNIPLIDYIKYEKRLCDMVKPAMNLSPFEKFLFAYNVTKKFKKYKENLNDKGSSRTLYEVLDNEYMVCVGYSTLLGDLLDKLGISNSEYSITLDTMLGNLPNDIEYIPDKIEKNGKEQDVKVEVAHHARRLIHLVDEKYGIDGIFVSDPTWDNYLNHDLYVHSLMSPNETLGNNNYLFLNFVSVNDLMFSSSMEEYMYKVKVWLDKNSNKMYENFEKSFVNAVFRFIDKIDVSFYTYLKTKYSDFLGFSSNINEERFLEFVTDVGEYFVSKCNYILDGKVLKSGIEEVYKKCYGYDDSDELDEKINSVMSINKKVYDMSFPKRYKILSDGTQEVYQNENNKFDIDSDLVVRN